MAKKPVGRPAIAEDEKRKARFVVKLNEAEYHEVRSAAGPKLTTWARETLLRAARRKKP